MRYLLIPLFFLLSVSLVSAASLEDHIANISSLEGKEVPNTMSWLFSSGNIQAYITSSTPSDPLEDITYKITASISQSKVLSVEEGEIKYQDVTILASEGAALRILDSDDILSTILEEKNNGEVKYEVHRMLTKMKVSMVRSMLYFVSFFSPDAKKALLILS